MGRRITHRIGVCLKCGVPRRCLIVDDDPMYREILARVVRSIELEPTEVADAHAAVAALRQRDYEVVLLDLRLAGGADGGQVLDFIRRAKPHLLRCVLCVTGSPEMISRVARDVACVDKGNLVRLEEKLRSLL